MELGRASSRARRWCSRRNQTNEFIAYLFVPRLEALDRVDPKNGMTTAMRIWHLLTVMLEELAREERFDLAAANLNPGQL